jgi:leucyl aminopeptidase
MLFSTVSHFEKRQAQDALIIPFWEKGGKAVPASMPKESLKLAKHALESKDFSGKEGEVILLYQEGSKERRCILVGLGKEEHVSAEVLRRSFAAAVRLCQKKKLKKINLLVPNVVELRKFSVEECVHAIADGVLLANYKWSLRSKPPEDGELLEHVTLIGVLPKVMNVLEQATEIAEGVYLARDLINGNADDVTPSHLCEVAVGISKQFPDVKTTIFDKKELERMKMGLLLAVGRGSPNAPALVMMQYNGNPKSKDRTVVVGKGVTFDTGGLNLKPTGSMETMRDDMSGGAATIAIVAVAAALKLKVNVTGLIPTAENGIDGLSFKPGDVYTSYLGKTVEIGNTDAEGRLILADALAYAVKHLQPTRIIDFATLTGSMVIALGDGISGVFANNERLSDQLIRSSERTSELLWKMPLHKPYKEMLKSDIADLKNIGGRPAGSVTAALFLEEFVGNVPWAHIDIAGTAFSNKEEHYLPKNGVGFGVRLIIDFLKQLS